MGVLEIVFLVIGVGCFILSFFLSEKLSSSDINEFEKMSKQDMNAIVERQLREADEGIRVMIEDGMKDAMEDFEGRADRILNNKIMGISDYSDSVIESIEKSHKEIVFMYNMLIEKQEALTTLTAEIQQLESNLRNIKANVTEFVENAAYENAAEAAEVIQAIDDMPGIDISTLSEEESLDNTIKEGLTPPAEDGSNLNDKIIAMHKEGFSEVEIAKRLGRGLGEIKLVLGLFIKE